MKKKTFLYLATLSMTAVLAGCGGGGTTTKFTVKVNNGTGGGTFDSGASCTVTATVAEGYQFESWKEGETVVSTVNPYTFKVTKDIELTAVTTKITPTIKYTLTLNANGGSFDSTKSDTKTIKDCLVVSQADLEEPTKTDSEFKGWYLDSATTNAVTFPYTLSQDTTVYAGWTTMPTSDFTHKEDACITVSELKDNKYTITINAPSNNITPTIELSGNLANAQLDFAVAKAYKDKGDVNIVLNNFKIVSSDSLCPINIAKCNNNFIITAKEGTSNYVFDKRASTTTFDEDGAINAKSNLTFNGGGSLFINDKTSYQGFSDAIYCSKNITIENTNLKAYGVDYAIRGKRSISILDSNITAYSKTGIGLKTSDEDVQDNKRCGDISIKGNTTLTVATAEHGIAASHDLLIDKTEAGSPKINVYTSEYASSYVTIETPTVTEKDMYIYLPKSLMDYAEQNNYRFAVLFDDDSWDNAKLKKIYSSSMANREGPGPGPGPTPGGGTEGYYFGLDRPISSKTFNIYLFDKDHDANSTTEGDYVAKMSSAQSFPSSGDTAKIKSISGSLITTESTFGTYTTMVDKSTNPDKADYGCKGITAGNILNINSGIINIKTKDDAIQSKFGKLFPADSTAGFAREVGQGILNINGDDTKIYITAADDGMNAVTLNIGETGNPLINISTSREGLEASIINYKNGSTSLYAKDDGVNGSSSGNKSNSDISVTVSGGYLDVQVADGDTDGIDSNNTYTQTGGIVISRASSNSEKSTGLDTDGSATISGTGVFIALGSKPETVPTCSTQKGPISKSFTANTTHTINSTYSFTVTLRYSQYYYYLGANASAPTID